MAITVTCLRCRRDLDQPGGLMFSPPLDDNWTVAKDHLCATCYPIVRAWIAGTCTHDDRRRYVSTFWPDEGPCCARCIHRRHPGTLGFAESATHAVYWKDV